MFYKFSLAQIQQELEKGRLTAKGAALLAARILGWAGQAVPIGQIQEATKLARTSLYRALEELEKEGAIVRDRGRIWLAEEFPNPGKNFPNPGKELPKMGKEFPKMGTKNPESQTRSGRREALDNPDILDRLDKEDEEEQASKREKKPKRREADQPPKPNENTHNNTHGNKDLSSAPATARSRPHDEGQGGGPPTHPATGPEEEEELLAWIKREKLPLLPQKPVIPDAVARSLARHPEVVAEWKRHKELTAPPPPPPPRASDPEEVRRAILEGLRAAGLEELAKKKEREWRS